MRRLSSKLQPVSWIQVNVLVTSDSYFSCLLKITWFTHFFICPQYSNDIINIAFVHTKTNYVGHVDIFFKFFFSVRLLSVLRGHSVFTSPPQRPMTSDFEGCSYQILSITFLSDLKSWKRASISLFNVECQTREQYQHNTTRLSRRRPREYRIQLISKKVNRVHSPRYRYLLPQHSDSFEIWSENVLN